MKKLRIVMIVFGMGLMFSLNAGAQAKTAPNAAKAKAEAKEEAKEAKEDEEKTDARVERDMKELIPLLGLSGEQPQKMKEALLEHFNNRTSIFNSYHSQKPELQEKTRAENARYKEKVKSFLSKEQMEKLDAWKENPPAKKATK